jgi:hypothetical protein
VVAALCSMALWVLFGPDEVKRGQNSGDWHPHLHMIALAEVGPARNDCPGSGTTSRG